MWLAAVPGGFTTNDHAIAHRTVFPAARILALGFTTSDQQK